jgi:hypothetical protein
MERTLVALWFADIAGYGARAAKGFANAVGSTASFCCLISLLNHVGRKLLGDRAIELLECRGGANAASFNEISKKEETVK